MGALFAAAQRETEQNFEGFKTDVMLAARQNWIYMIYVDHADRVVRGVTTNAHAVCKIIDGIDDVLIERILKSLTDNGIKAYGFSSGKQSWMDVIVFAHGLSSVECVVDSSPAVLTVKMGNGGRYPATFSMTPERRGTLAKIGSDLLAMIAASVPEQPTKPVFVPQQQGSASSLTAPAPGPPVVEPRSP